MQHVLTDSYFNFSQQTFNAEKPVHVHEQYKTYRKQEKNLYFHSFQFLFIQTCLIQNICIHINNTVKVNYQNIYLYID